MTPRRPLTFWIATLAATIAAVVLLREILLPFVAGFLLAYLLDPLASRLERLGMNRLIATLTIMVAFIVSVVILIFCLLRALSASSLTSSTIFRVTFDSCRHSQPIPTDHG